MALNNTGALVNARIYTIDEFETMAQAMAWADGRITVIGSEEEVRKHITPEMPVHDAQGAVVFPGFIEAHGHPTAEMNFIGPDSLDIRASVLNSADEVLEVLRAAVATAEKSNDPEAWVTAFGWDPLLMPELPTINRAFLTELSPSIPISIMHYSAHASWTNDAGLAKLGLNRDTPNPPGSEYVRDESGELTGEGLELPASMIIMGPNMDSGEENFSDLLHHELQTMSQEGVTTTGDLAFHPDEYASMVRYQTSHRAPVRIRSYEMTGVRQDVPAPAEMHWPEVDSTMYRPVGMKVWSDGSPWVGNIATSFEYQQSEATSTIGISAGHRGCANYTEDQLRAICEEHYPKGWQIACHVHGDEAVDMVLDVFQDIQVRYPEVEDVRLRLEHCGSITDAQIQRAHALGVTISFFVAHIQFYGDILVELFGDRADAWTPAGAAAKVGMRISLHNDPPVTKESPLSNIQAAVCRTAPSGRVMGPQYRLSVAQAIRAQTIDAAWQVHSDHEVGSLDVGKFADFVFLSDSPYEVEPNMINHISIDQTWLSGQPVFVKEAAGALVS